MITIIIPITRMNTARTLAALPRSILLPRQSFAEDALTRCTVSIAPRKLPSCDKPSDQ